MYHGNRMTEKWWNEHISHFDPWEFVNWPGVSQDERTRMCLDYMNPWLIEKLNELREYVQKPIIINTGYAETGHSENSQHYLGNAADLYIKGLNLIEQFLAVEYLRYKFGGLGLYPEWRKPGLHLDIRSITTPTVARWVKRKGQYQPFHYGNLSYIMEMVY